MTLPTSGPISLNEIAAEFGLPANSVFPTAFYGKGGAPASGPLSFHDFYGRSNAAVATATPDEVLMSGNTTTITGGFCSCSVSGGVGPFTYSWVRTSGDSNISADNPTSPGTSFTAVAMGIGASRSAVFRCTVTDTGNGGAIALSNSVPVTAERDL